jgi:hypothetical protein
MNKNYRWLKLSEEANALDNLEKAYYFIREVHNDAKAWKWVITTMHSALYGFAICALRGTNNLGVTFDTKWGKRLISFPEAIKRSQDPKWMGMTVQSRHLQLTSDQEHSIARLNKEFRNGLEHYIPKLWLIELSGIPRIISHALDAIKFLALESGNYNHLTASQKKKIRSLIYQSQKILKAYRVKRT